MGFMSRDCRKVVNELEKLSGKKCTMQDIFDGEQLVYTYYAKTVCRHINRFYNPDSKGNPNTIAFYVKPTKSINKGKRTTDIWEMTENDKEIYSLITNNYLIEDFSIDQLKIIKDMGKFDIRDIKVGIQEAKRENIFSIHYLFRIVEGIVAKKEYMKANRQRIKELYSYNDNDDTISRNQIELAQMKYSWKNTLENVILEKKVRELYKNE